MFSFHSAITEIHYMLLSHPPQQMNIAMTTAGRLPSCLSSLLASESSESDDDEDEAYFCLNEWKEEETDRSPLRFASNDNEAGEEDEEEK